MEVCSRIVEGICHDLSFGVCRSDVQSVLDDHCAAHLRGESLERFCNMCSIAVYVQMVGVHRCDDGNLGEELEEGPVEFVGLDHDHIIMADQKIAVIVLGNSSEEAIAMVDGSRGACRISELEISGRELGAIGFRGKEIGEVLCILMDAVIADPSLNTREGLVSMATELKRTREK